MDDSATESTASESTASEAAPSEETTSDYSDSEANQGVGRGGRRAPPVQQANYQQAAAQLLGQRPVAPGVPGGLGQAAGAAQAPDDDEDGTDTDDEGMLIKQVGIQQLRSPDLGSLAALTHLASRLLKNQEHRAYVLLL